jgi:hypothetical protein
MANWTTNILTVHGEEARVSCFREAISVKTGDQQECDLNKLVPPGPEGPLAAWGTTSGAFDVGIPEPDKRPLEVVFESRNVPPHELVRRISILFPTLVFALRFLDECYCYVGWAVFANGECHEARRNQDVYRAGDRRFDREAWKAEQLDPDAATIDGYEAVDWSKRFFDALNVMPRELATDPELAEDAANHAAMANMVEDLAPEYEHAQTPLGDRRRSLEEFCENASLLEARAECRLAVERALETHAAMQKGTLR